MADTKGRKRKREKADEFVHIRAKGQFLKIPIAFEHDNKQDVRVGGMSYYHRRTNQFKLIRLIVQSRFLRIKG